MSIYNSERILALYFYGTYVCNLLQQTSGNISQAARLSGLTRAALQRIMKRHGISGSEFKV